jgi:hypothetical protein
VAAHCWRAWASACRQVPWVMRWASCFFDCVWLSHEEWLFWVFRGRRQRRPFALQWLHLAKACEAWRAVSWGWLRSRWVPSALRSLSGGCVHPGDGQGMLVLWNASLDYATRCALFVHRSEEHAPCDGGSATCLHTTLHLFQLRLQLTSASSCAHPKECAQHSSSSRERVDHADSSADVRTTTTECADGKVPCPNLVARIRPTA